MAQTHSLQPGGHAVVVIARGEGVGGLAYVRARVREATPRPAAASSPVSLGASPKATTRSQPMPRPARTDATADTLSASGADTSSSPGPEEVHRTAPRTPSAGGGAAESMCTIRHSTGEPSGTTPTRKAVPAPLARMSGQPGPISRSCSRSTAQGRCPSAAISARTVAGVIARIRRTPPPSRSLTTAPFDDTRKAPRPDAADSSPRADQAGRAVAKTTRVPWAATARSAATARPLTLPSDSSSVPSRSVTTTAGRLSPRMRGQPLRCVPVTKVTSPERAHAAAACGGRWPPRTGGSATARSPGGSRRGCPGQRSRTAPSRAG